MRRVIEIGIVLVLVAMGLAWGDTATHGLPDQSRQRQQWFGDYLDPIVVSGCLPSVPGSGTTLPTMACEMYVANSTTGENVYINQSTSTMSLSGGNGTYWIAVHQDRSTSVSSWTRVSGTHYMWRVNSTQPANPTNGQMFAKVVVSGGNITTAERIYTRGNQRLLVVTDAPYNAPNDASADASTAINQAILDAASSRYVVFLPCGHYKTTAQISMRSTVMLEGESRDCVFIEPDTGTSIPRPILFQDVTNASVRNLQVDCGDETVTGRQGIAVLDASSYILIENNKVRRCGQYGILAAGDVDSAPYNSGGQGIVVRNNIVDMGDVPAGACTGIIAIEYFPRGPASFLATPGPIIEGNTVVAEQADGGIKLNNALGGRVIGNYVSGVTCSTAAGAIIDAPGDYNTVIQGNVVYNTRLGITVGGAPRANASGGNELRTVGARIIGNVVDTYTVAGLFSTDGNTDVTIAQNYISVNGGTTTGHCIDFQPQPAASSGADYTRLNIQGNTCVGQQIGLYLQASSDAAYGYTDLVAQGNTLSTALSTGRAIDITLAPYALITGNKINGHRNAISMGTGSNYVTLSHNHAKDLNSADTASQSCFIIVGTDPIIVDNHCINTSGSYHADWGLSLNNTQRVVMHGNVFSGMDSGDITTAGTAITAANPVLQATYVDQSANTVGATTDETDIGTITLPRSYFTLFGGLRFSGFGDTAGAGGVKLIKVYFGGSQLGSDLSVAAGTSSFSVEGYVLMPEANVTSQHTYIRGYDAGTLELAAYTGLSIDTTASTVIVKITCDKADAADTCRGRGWMVQPWR